MNKEDLYNDPENEANLNAFEQQLRSFNPSPPQTRWHELTQLLLEQEQTEQVSIGFASPRGSNSASKWLQIATHAAAILIGVGIGVVSVRMLQPAIATLPPVDVASRATVTPDRSESTMNYTGPQTIASDAEFQTQPNREPAALGSRKGDSWKMTPLTLDIESNRWRRMRHVVRPVALEESANTLDPDASSDHPKSGPELMREILNEQARSPTQRSRSFRQTLPL